MHARRGFTLIELMITMAIMVILVGVAIVSLRGSQANARDAKRVSDADTIARGLEQRYDAGLAKPSDGTNIMVWFGSCAIHPSDVSGLQDGTYPSTQEILYANGGSDTGFCPNQATRFITEDLPGTSDTNYAPPSSGSFVAATNNTPPTATTVGNNYYYLPLAANGNLCNSIFTACVKYNLYYVSEVDGTLHTIQSKHQ